MIRTITVQSQDVPGLRILDTLRLEGHNFGYGTEHYRTLSNETIQWGAKDVVVRDGIAYVSAGYLGVAILDCSRSDRLVLLSRVPTAGNATEIALKSPYLFVADRPGAVAVIDASDPERPRALGCYDSVEYATGIDVSGNVMAVCNRPHGLEFSDVSDPAHPRFLSEVPVGEAQGVRIRGRFAYAGIWRDSRIAVVDIGDPANPRHAADVPLDGYGWGVGIGDGLLAAATGHHDGRGGHGHGRGVEILRIKDDGIPETVCRVKTPPFYRRTNDWWRARFHGNLLLHADGLNGAFVYDCRDPEDVRVMGRAESFDYAGGVAVAGDRLLVADMRSGVHLLELAAEPVAGTGRAHAPTAMAAVRTLSHKVVYATKGSIRHLAAAGDLIVAACGAAGLEVLDPAGGSIRRISSLVTPGPASDVVVEGKKAWAALRGGGAVVVDLSDAGKPRITAHWGARPLHLIAKAGDWLIGIRGEGGVESLRAADLACGDGTASLPFFPFQLAAWEGRVIAVSGHEAAAFSCSGTGAVSKVPLRLQAGDRETLLTGTIGVAVRGNRALFICGGSLCLAESTAREGAFREIATLPLQNRGRGSLAWDGRRAVLCDVHSGAVATFLVDRDALRATGTSQLPGHPGPALIRDGTALIPCGHAGIASLEMPD